MVTTSSVEPPLKPLAGPHRRQAAALPIPINSRYSAAAQLPHATFMESKDQFIQSTIVYP